MLKIIRGFVDPLKRMGYSASAAVEVRGEQKIHKLYAIFDERSRRVMVIAHPVKRGDMAAVALCPWTAPIAPLSGDLLDELVDPRAEEGLKIAIKVLIADPS